MCDGRYCRHAGVYTAEEVALITRDKMIRLQSLYIDQFKRLQHLLREKRRKYLHTVNQDRQAYGQLKGFRERALLVHTPLMAGA